MRVAIALLALSLCGAAHAQTMYKWIDEKGLTHFASEPPADGKAQKIEVKPQPPSSGAQPTPQRLEDVRKRELELREQRLGREKREDEARQEAGRNKVRCARAHNDLEVLQRGRRVYSMNERGERVYLEDKQRAAEIESLQRAIAANCS